MEKLASTHNIVYRTLRYDENPDQGLYPKDPNAGSGNLNDDIQKHILNGSKPGFRDQFISTTKNLETAKAWASDTCARIAVIDIDRISGTVYDVSTRQALAGFGITYPSMAYSFALSAHELLIDGFVPAEAILAIRMPPDF